MSLAPMTAGPVCRPMRICIFRPSGLSSAIVRCMSMAASTAQSASGNRHITASANSTARWSVVCGMALEDWRWFAGATLRHNCPSRASTKPAQSLTIAADYPQGSGVSTASDTNNMALFCDFENVALGVREAKYSDFDIQKVLEKLLL